MNRKLGKINLTVRVPSISRDVKSELNINTSFPPFTKHGVMSEVTRILIGRKWTLRAQPNHGVWITMKDPVLDPCKREQIAHNISEVYRKWIVGMNVSCVRCTSDYESEKVIGTYIDPQVSVETLDVKALEEKIHLFVNNSPLLRDLIYRGVEVIVFI